MPAGGPQGTVLGMFLFVILINPLEFSENVSLGKHITAKAAEPIKNMHFKYIDDFHLLRQLI